MTAVAETRSGPMVVACLRIGDPRPRVDPLTGAVERDELGIGMSPADAAALEHAFRVAGAWSGHVVVVSAAPPSADPVLRDARALGATVLRVAVPDPTSEPGYAEDLAGDEQELAAAIVAALAPYGQPALVLCGDRSADRGTGALPAFLAHQLGAAQALGLVALSVADQATSLVAERRLDGGWRERLRIPCPAVCSVEAAGVRLRRASLTATLAAQRAEISEIAGGSSPHPGRIGVGPLRPFRPRTRVVPPPEGEDPRLRLLALTGALVAHDPPTVVGPVEAPAAADALLAFLQRHGYLGDQAGVEGGP
jgi:electron transfer flavoprotein beta subunit